MGEEGYFKKPQQEVHDWVGQFKIQYFKPLDIIVQTAEEFGELAREVMHSYGPKKKKPREKAGSIWEEITDMFFALICLANSLGIDLDEAWKRKMDKQYGRDNYRFERK